MRSLPLVTQSSAWQLSAFFSVLPQFSLLRNHQIPLYPSRLPLTTQIYYLHMDSQIPPLQALSVPFGIAVY